MPTQKELNKSIPYGDLAILPLESSRAIGEKVDRYISDWRRAAAMDPTQEIHFTKY